MENKSTRENMNYKDEMYPKIQCGEQNCQEPSL